MRFPPLVAGRFIRRDNRFRATVEVEGEAVAAYLPNSGRMRELLTPGARCFLHRGTGARRKTAFDLVLVEQAGVPVSVNSHLPNDLFAEALAAGRLEPFRACAAWRREVRLGDSRLDFQLVGDRGRICWVEIKSVTLVENGTARFPDAPTARGRRHMRELTEVAKRGERAAAVFIIQRPDAQAFAPNERADERFGDALRAAVRAGVEVYAWRCAVSLREITIGEMVEVRLSM